MGRTDGPGRRPFWLPFELGLKWELGPTLALRAELELELPVVGGQ